MFRGLAHYRLLKTLAVGSQAHVYLALDTRRDRRVCIKIYHLQGDRSLRRRVEEEAWKLARVNSRRVVEILDVVAHGPELALVTTYVPGCDLGQLLASGEPLPAADALSIASDLAGALAALRQARIVHGDLSPRNVFIDRAGRATVGDFGVSVMRGEQIVGFSVDALAPELFSGALADFRSDFFALGLLLHRSLTGRHPFMRDGLLDRSSLAAGLRVRPLLPELAPEASQAVGDLLQDLLAADPAKRPARPFELRHRLAEVRRLLPASEGLGQRVAVVASNQPPVEMPLELPASLVRLPAYRRFGNALAQFWNQSRLSVRFLTVFMLTVPVFLATLWWTSPIACIGVANPRLRIDPAAGSPLPTAAELRARLTSMLKDAAPDAWILGTGVDSDSRPVVGPYGLRDRCVAERELQTHIMCHRTRCTIEMRSETPEGVYRSQLSLPSHEGQQRLEDALRQLVEERLESLLP